MTRCVMKDGEECTDMQDAHKKIEVIKDEIDSKVSWPIMYMLIVGFLLLMSSIGGILYARGEKNQEDIKELAISNTELKVAYKNTEENTKQILEILREQKRDKDAEKIASKELKEYNTIKN